MKNFKFIASVILSIGIFGLASCSKNDATYNPNYEKEVVASQYMKNFEVKYGKISADATWDFSNVPTINGEIDVNTCEQPTFKAGTRSVSSAAVAGAFEYGLSPNADIQITTLQPVNTINDLAYIRA